MDWKTDSDLNTTEDSPYTSFQSGKSGRIFDRLELPIILMGAGLIAMVILFVLFMPRKNQVTLEDYKHIVSRLDQLEKKINTLGPEAGDVREYDPADHPVQYQQLVNWIKSNAEVITETMKSMDALEKKIEGKFEQKPAGSTGQASASVTAPVPATPSATAKAPAVVTPEKAKPAIIEETILPAPPEKVAKPETASQPSRKPVPEKKPAPSAVMPTATPKPAPAPTTVTVSEKIKSEPVKLIFHRVEKGETLYRISRNYGITVAELQALNDMKKDDLLIHVGQELIVKKEKP